jgi:hypothetical protein
MRKDRAVSEQTTIEWTDATWNPITVAYGGGLNSTAMLVEMVNRDIRPDLILFADTGGERPDTYAYRDRFSEWLTVQGFPEIITVRYECEDATLEDECLRRKALPSPAYGFRFRSCSEKWKQRPQKKYIKRQFPEAEFIERWVGFDADEANRVKMSDDERFVNHYPLVDWGIGRNHCRSVIKAAGLCVPGKSSCFFCPAIRPPELMQLHREYPELVARGLSMEAHAVLKKAKGLGGDYRWSYAIHQYEDQGELLTDWRDDLVPPCECYDGD